MFAILPITCFLCIVILLFVKSDKLKTTIMALMFLTVTTHITLMIKPWWSDNGFKEYVIQNESKVTKFYSETAEDTVYELPYHGLYFQKLSIKVNGDKDAYNVIVWGNRESIFWDYFKDYSFSDYVGYFESKNKSEEDIELDRDVIEILTKK